MQFVEIDLAILATSREAHIVGVPVNTHDLTLMSSETHTITDGTCVEIEYVDLLILYHAGEEMASIWELNLVTPLVHVRLEWGYLVAQHIAEYDFVLQSDDQV